MFIYSYTYTYVILYKFLQVSKISGSGLDLKKNHYTPKRNLIVQIRLHRQLTSYISVTLLRGLLHAQTEPYRADTNVQVPLELCISPLSYIFFILNFHHFFPLISRCALFLCVTKINSYVGSFQILRSRVP